MSPPTLFVSHGSPTVALDPTPAHRFLRELGTRLGRPRAIFCVSAHWETARPALTASPRPATLHDFHGFPEALYRLRYPAPGAPELAREVADLLAAAGLAAELDPERGLDHGAWVPLLLIYPQADIPVVQLSLQTALGPAHHRRLGEILAPLRARDVLILGSGALTHDLADVLGRLRAGATATSDPPPAWARAFAGWVRDVLARGDLEALVDYRRKAPGAGRAHPTEEHFLPLLVAAAAGGGRGTCLHESFEYGSLAMSVYAFPAA